MSTPTNMPLTHDDTIPASPPPGELPPHPNSEWIPAIGWSIEAEGPASPHLRPYRLKRFNSVDSLRSAYEQGDFTQIMELLTALSAMYDNDYKSLKKRRKAMKAMRIHALYVSSADTQ